MIKETTDVMTFLEIAQCVNDVAIGLERAINGQPRVAIAYVLLQFLRDCPQTAEVMQDIHERGLRSVLDSYLVGPDGSKADA